MNSPRNLVNLPKNISSTNFNVAVLLRILSVLSQKGPLKITNLAMDSHLNHNSCKKYVNLMVMLDWINMIFQEKTTFINISMIGRTVLKQLEKINCKTFLT